MDYDVIVIGGGPAGLTAAIYASRARSKTLLLESFSVPGQAVITDCIENYPGFPDGTNGFELIEKFKKQAEKFGTEFSVGDVKKIEAHKEQGFKGWKVVVEGKAYTSLTLIIASGARPKKLDVPGENRLQGRGVSYCATCDGPLYKDKNIVVVGGGDAAVEEALFLTKFAAKVTLIHRRSRLRATKILQERALANRKLEFLWDSIVTEIVGKDRVKAVKTKNLKTEKENDFSCEQSERHRGESPCEQVRDRRELTCEGLFLFVGYEPNTGFLKGLVKLDKNEYILADDDMNTSKKSIFACGDCRQKSLRQIVTACGDGAVAAFSAQQYVEELKGIAYK